MNTEEAGQIANEALRSIVTNPDYEHIKDLIGSDLDITDEAMEEAVDILFCGQKKPAAVEVTESA
jgi:hypothetical protein